jgi:hypothetical protein
LNAIYPGYRQCRKISTKIVKIGRGKRRVRRIEWTGREEKEGREG